MDESLTHESGVAGGTGVRRGAVVLTTVAIVAANLPFMYWTMFSSFARYDDEGYLLLTVRHFLLGDRLYAEVFSPYGPFYFLYKFVSYAGGLLTPTHDLNRILTIGEWGIAAPLLGCIAYELTRSTWAAGIATFLSIGALTGLVKEPGHPQGLLLVLVPAALLAGMRAARTERPGRWILPGVLVAAITLTKVNVGVFLILALALSMLSAVPASRVARACFLAVAACAALLPAALMRPHLMTWAGPYCVVVTASVLAAIVVTAAPPKSEAQRARDFVAAVAGAAVLTAATIAFTAMRGTAVMDAVRGWIVSPMRLRSEFWSPAPVSLASIGVALAALSLACAWAARAVRGGLDAWVTPFRFVAVSVLGVMLTRTEAPALLLAFAVPFAWLVAVPAAGSSWTATESFARRLLCLATVLQALVAYPIAGTQQQMATYLVIVVGVVCATDLVRAAPPLFRWAVAPIALVFVVVAVSRSAAAANVYRGQTPLNLRGASRIRLPHDQAAEYQWVVANLRAHAETFVSLPGLNSLYFWTGERPPTATNVTTWMTLLDDGQQRSIARSLLSHDRACAVVTDYSFWTRGQDLARAPLFRTLQDDFIPTPLTTGTFTILDRRRARPRSLDNYLLFDSREFARDDDRMAAPLPALQRERLSLEARFRTTRDGTILSVADRLSGTPTLYLPMVYVGSDGRVYAQARWGRPQPLRSRLRVDDGRWHHVVLKIEPQRDTLYLDGRLESGSPGRERAMRQGLHAVIGSGYTAGFPSAPDGWFPFRGTIASVIAN